MEVLAETRHLGAAGVIGHRAGQGFSFLAKFFSRVVILESLFLAH